MLFDRHRPHAFRERRVEPAAAQAVAAAEEAAVLRRATRAPGLRAWAVHLAHDRMRVVTVEAWNSADAFRQDPDAREPGVGLFAWVATGGRKPTPVDDPEAGVIVIDTFPVWRPLVRPVSLFNARNGEGFNRQPGCVSTTVMRGLGVGRIATYARWRTVADFTAAFTATTGHPVDSTDAINEAAARMTAGLIRTDYHAYDLVAFQGERS
ncbi:hypothetical protein [Jannaschia formosa]|uniref:hypothetical protein n=1 Tax=Jannaschia formosa TaxID=2259592 RepID=UPI0010755825|nr:hypothetical protein [Jannaschia formosa]TFL16564.1 hypothetical protein DR046_19385 [Jannaschia formosa]